MQKLTLIFLINILICTTIYSQYDEEYKEIRSLIESYELTIAKLTTQLDKSKYEQGELKIKKAEIEKELTIQRKENVKDSLTKVHLEEILQDELTALEEQLNFEKDNYIKVKQRLNGNIKKVKDYREKNKTLIEKNAELTAKLDTIITKLGWAYSKSVSSEEDLTKKCYLESYIKNYDIGNLDRKGNLVSFNKFKDGEYTSFNKGLGKKLTHLNINDAAFSEFIDESAIYFDDFISGKILIYADGKLNSEIDLNLIRKKGFFQSLNSFELKMDEIVVLNTPVGQGAKINLAFIENENYDRSNKSVLKNYVESNDKGYFLISSKKPSDEDYYYEKEGVKFKESDILASHSEDLKIILYDFDDLDGDKVSLYLNGKKVISNIELPHRSMPYEQNIKLRKGDNILKLKLTSQGSVGGCTANYDLHYLDGELLKENQRIVKPPNEIFPPLLILFGSS